MDNNDNTKKEKKKVGLFDYLFLLLLLLTTISISIAFQFSSSNASKTDKDTNTDTNSYTVAFNVNIEGETMESLSIKDGELINEPTAPTKEGYTFGGWYRDEACLYRWDFAHDKVTANTTLYPKWTPIAVPANYTVTFNKNGHGADTASQTIVDGSLVTKPTDPTETGYTFGGWFKDKDCEYKWDFAKDKVTTDTTLYAKWTAGAVAANYTVSFDMKGHGDQIDSRVVTEGSLLTAPTAPTETNYTFGGWYKDNSCEYKWDFTAEKVTANTTLYAKWTANPVITNYTVTFNMKGHGDQIDSQVVAKGDLMDEPTAPVVNGYSFDGWYKDEGFDYKWDFSVYPVTSNMTLYAKWSLINYTITYESSDPYWVNDPTNPTTYNIESPAIILADPYTIAWPFDGWTTETVTTPTKGLEIASGSYGNITITANWIEVYTVYTVTFNMNGHDTENCPAPITDAVNADTISAPSYTPPEPTGPSGAFPYSFRGWFKDEGCTQEWDFANDIVLGNITLYAGWIGIK